MVGSARGLLLLGLLASGGCGFGSLNATFDPRAGEFDARLLGTWRVSGERELAVVGRGRNDTYRVDYTDEDGATGRFRARLGRLDGRRVLDLQPDGRALETVSDAFKNLLLPLHTMFFVDSIGQEVRLLGLRPDSLEAYLEREPQAVAHERTDDLIVLTASTPELEHFLADYGRRLGVFDEPIVWVKQAGTAGTPSGRRAAPAVP